MANNLDVILDECIDRINRGESLEACFTDYPDHVEQLKPLLQAMLTAQQVYTFVPSPNAKRTARQRFNRALQEQGQRHEERQPVFAWLSGWSNVWATATAVLLIALFGYFGLRSALLPGETVPQPDPGIVTPIPQPGPAPVVVAPQLSPEGNFVFLISDDVNAISDFERVDVSISNISMLTSSTSGKWVEFEPELAEVDLTLVQGDKTQEIWRGDIPENEYTKVSIQVSDVRGILKTGEEVEIKLPSQKLHISKPFQITPDTVTSFTYDLTVVAAGNIKSGINYILKPQVDQSGATYKPIEPKEKAKGEGGKSTKPGNKAASLNLFYSPHSYASTKVTIHWHDTFSLLALYRLDGVKAVAL
ncbi:DUF4382 domain-containing protein [Chloroflexota bacterium]